MKRKKRLSNSSKEGKKENDHRRGKPGTERSGVVPPLPRAKGYALVGSIPLNFCGDIKRGIDFVNSSFTFTLLHL